MQFYVYIKLKKASLLLSLSGFFNFKNRLSIRDASVKIRAGARTSPHRVDKNVVQLTLKLRNCEGYFFGGCPEAIDPTRAHSLT